MNAWFSTLILLGFLGIVSRLLLPEGEKSKLYPPLSFLLSLLTVLTVFSPLFSIKQEDGVDLSEFLESAEINSDEMERRLLERSVQRMYENTKVQFPTANFTLYVYTEEGSIPTEIAVSCDGTEGDAIAAFLENNYQIKTRPYEKGERENDSMAPEQ